MSTILSKHIQARLHPSNPSEEKAIEIWTRWTEEENLQPRDLITALILSYEGYTPEDFRTDVDTRLEQLTGRLDAKIDQIANRLETNIAELLRNIKTTDPQGLRRFANSADEDLDVDEEFIRNAQKGVRRTFKQRQAERDNE